MDSVGSYVISSVVIPPASSDLTILATVKDDWMIKGGKDDSFLSRAISRCSVAAQQFCNRSFGIATYQDAFRLEQGYRTGRIVNGARSPIKLSAWPLVSVVSVTVTPPNSAPTILTAGTDYEVDQVTGFIYRLDSLGQPRDWNPVQTVIIYQAGYILPGQNPVDFPGAQTLPVDIEDAVGRMVFSRYSERQRDPFIKSEEVAGISRVDYIVGNPNQGDGGNMSPDVADILNNYRQPVTG